VGEPADTLEAIRSTDGFDSDSNLPEFYLFEQKNPGQGARYLTAKAFGVAADDVTKEEAKFSMTMTMLLTELTNKQQEALAECMLQAATTAKDADLSIFKSTRVPVSMQDFKDFYLTSRNAISNNLPHPRVRETEDGNHAYVTLTDVIGYMLASGTEVDKFHFEAASYLDGIHNAVFDDDNNPATISTSHVAYRLFIELRKDTDGHFVVYFWIK
jgi:hypothetical protein